jgi:hypothetical protein
MVVVDVSRMLCRLGSGNAAVLVITQCGVFTVLDSSLSSLERELVDIAINTRMKLAKLSDTTEGMYLLTRALLWIEA